MHRYLLGGMLTLKWIPHSGTQLILQPTRLGNGSREPNQQQRTAEVRPAYKADGGTYESAASPNSERNKHEQAQSQALVHRVPQSWLTARCLQETCLTVSNSLFTAATRFLLGLRYDEEQILQWIAQDMSWIRESSLYQIAVAEGREEGRDEGRELGQLEEARRLVLELGAERLGPPEQEAVHAIGRLDDHEELKRLVRNSFTASSWQELLADAPGR